MNKATEGETWTMTQSLLASTVKSSPSFVAWLELWEATKSPMVLQFNWKEWQAPEFSGEGS